MKTSFLRKEGYNMTRKATQFLLTAGIFTAVLTSGWNGVEAAPTNTKADVESTTAFSDVPKTHTYYNVINTMEAQGIISGYADGTFKPNELITRQHAALLINNAVDLPQTVFIALCR